MISCNSISNDSIPLLIPQRGTSKMRQLQISRVVYQLQSFPTVCLKWLCTSVQLKTLSICDDSASTLAAPEDSIGTGSSTREGPMLELYGLYRSFHIGMKERNYHSINQKSNKSKSSTNFFPGSTGSSIAARNSPSRILQVVEACWQLGLDQVGIQRAFRHVRDSRHRQLLSSAVYAMTLRVPGGVRPAVVPVSVPKPSIGH